MDTEAASAAASPKSARTSKPNSKVLPAAVLLGETLSALDPLKSATSIVAASAARLASF